MRQDWMERLTSPDDKVREGVIAALNKKRGG